jgi:MinD-like ATPase involved in chromosome partitioning or flagellar assembly
MDEFVQPSVITAIADAEFEGMVSSALYESGWSVIARPLNFETLAKNLNESAIKNVLVIFSVDLPGLTKLQLQNLSPAGTSLFGFTDAAGSARGFSEISQRPSNPVELLAYIRGNIRSPLLRVPLLQSKQKFKAKIIGIGSAGHYTGATTLALNIAQELVLLDKKTLLIDANFQASAIATLLDLHKIADEDRWRDLSDNFSVAEITQDNVSDFPTRAAEAASYFDYVIIDLGSLLNISNDLSDRRWSSQVKIWVSRFAHSILITSGSDVLQSKRLKNLCNELAEMKLPAQISLFIVPAETINKRERLQIVDFKPFVPKEVVYLPMDSKICAAARKEHTALSEVNAKAPLRKVFAEIALQITT